MKRKRERFVARPRAESSALEPQRSSTRTVEHHEGTTLHSCCAWHRAPCQPSRHHICQAQATRHFRQQRNGQAGTRLKARAHGDPWDVNEKRGKRLGALRQAVAEAARRQDGRSRAPSRRDGSSRGKTSALESPACCARAGAALCAGVSRAFRCCMHVSERGVRPVPSACDGRAPRCPRCAGRPGGLLGCPRRVVYIVMHMADGCGMARTCRFSAGIFSPSASRAPHTAWPS